MQTAQIFDSLSIDQRNSTAKREHVVEKESEREASKQWALEVNLYGRVVGHHDESLERDEHDEKQHEDGQLSGKAQKYVELEDSHAVRVDRVVIGDEAVLAEKVGERDEHVEEIGHWIGKQVFINGVFEIVAREYDYIQ